MPTTPTYALPYPAATDPADVPADIQALATQVAKVLGGALSATPPASPIEGQVWAMSPTAGVVWLFRYNAGSASAFKWEFLGGPALFAEVTGVTENTPSTTYVALTTPGPSITVPRAGDYDVTISSLSEDNTANNICSHSYDIGATAAVDADALIHTNAPAGFSNAQGIRKRRKLGLTAAAALVSKYKASGGQAIFQHRWMEVSPVRVS